jgi:hypothetical protein
MDKRQIIKWLKRKEEESLRTARNNYSLEMDMQKETVEKELGVDMLVDNLHKKYLEMDRIIDTWRSSVTKEGISVHGSSWYFFGGIKQMANSKSRIYDKVTNGNEFTDNTSTRKALTKKHETIREGIKKNYTNLLAVAQTLTGKQLLEYVKKLGFDVSEIEVVKDPVTTALTVQLDSKYLIINKVGEK